jgi:hypothetical protein
LGKGGRAEEEGGEKFVKHRGAFYDMTILVAAGGFVRFAAPMATMGMKMGATKGLKRSWLSRLWPFGRFARQFSYDQSQFPISHVFSYSPRRSWGVQPEL